MSLLEEKGYDPLVYRLFCLQSHYRKPLTFSFDSLDNAAQAYQKLAQRIAALSKEGQPDVEAARPYQEQFQAALGNDLNTSLGLTVLYDVLKADLSDATKRYLIDDFDQVLSLGLLEAAEQASQKPAGKELSPRRQRRLRRSSRSGPRRARPRIGPPPTPSGTSWRPCTW